MALVSNVALRALVERVKDRRFAPFAAASA
jgi:hypothetical protein